MSKKVVWPEARIHNPVRKPGTYRNLNEMLEKADKIRLEQEKAQSYLRKAMLPMLKLLEIRMTKALPLIVMRPLRYQTSVMDTDQEDNDGFYNVRKSNSIGKFVDIVKVINPGTQLMLKGLDNNMREFIFEDAVGKEHAISYDDKNLLLTQTDIFETVQKYFEEENKGE